MVPLDEGIEGIEDGTQLSRLNRQFPSCRKLAWRFFQQPLIHEDSIVKVGVKYVLHTDVMYDQPQ